MQSKFIKVVDDLLTPDECNDLIKKLDTDSLELVDRGIAIYDRNMMLSKELSDKIYSRIIHLLPDDIKPIASVNEMFRFSKYREEGHFDIHRDGVNQDQYSKRSIMTINIFLNSGFKGGETDFLLDDKETLFIRAVPKTGRGAIFDRNIWHRGNKVNGGYKYLIRTDVMT